MKRLLIAAAAALIATGAFAADPSWRDFPGVENTSFVEPGGQRVLQLSVVIKATPEQVWQAITTEAGWKTWAAPSVWVEWGVGGTIETSYTAGAAKGADSNIVNRIEAYVPGRMLAIRNVKAPKGFFSTDAFSATATILELAPAGEGRTRVTLTNVGYGQGADFDSVYKHFEWGDAYTLDGLRRRFEEGPRLWARTEAETARAVEAMKGD